jgi:hypothetical protein
MPGSAPAAASKSGGFFSSLAHDITGGAHWVASKSARAGSDIKAIPTGTYDILKNAVVGDYQLATTGHESKKLQKQIEKQTDAVLSGTINAPVAAARHPLRDPFMTGLMFLPAAHGVASAGIRGAEAGAALKAGEGTSGAVRAARSPVLLKTPRLVSEPEREPVSLVTSHNAARRLVQAGIDKSVNKALANERAKGLLGHEGAVANYGRYRMGGTLAERARSSIRYHQALVANTRVAGRGVAQFAKSIKGTVADPQLTAQAILHSLHDNVLPEHEAIFHEIQAQRGINPEQNEAWAQAFSDAHKLGVVRLGEDNRLVVDQTHPLAAPLAKADSALEKLGAYSENQLVARGLREPSTLEDRKARVGQLVQRSKPLLGDEPQPLRDTRRQVANLKSRIETALDREEKLKAKQQEGVAAVKAAMGGKGKAKSVDLSNPHRDKIIILQHQLQAAEDRVTSLEDRYGLSSPQRRLAIQQGIGAREDVADAAHRLFGAEAPHHLSRIEGFARHYARTHDVTPHEFYAQFIPHIETPKTIASLPEEIAPLYEAAPAMPHEPLPHVDVPSVAKRIVDSGVKLPKGWSSAELEAVIERIMPLVEEGAPYRDWYARGATVIQDAAHRLSVPVKKFLATVAVTSQGANPTFNLRLAAKAAKEFAETGDVKDTRYIFKQSEAVDALKGVVPETAKRNNYYANFLAEISPEEYAREYGTSADNVTIDRHISRMVFGETKGSPGIYYPAARAIFSELAKELGWTGREVQAAAWVPWKAQALRDAAVKRGVTKGKLVDASHERFLPTAADAYERGHAENIGSLYHRVDENPAQRALDAHAGHDLEGLPTIGGVKYRSNAEAQEIRAQSTGEMEKALQDAAGGMTFPEDWLNSMVPGGKILGSYNPEQGMMRLSSKHAVPETMLHEALHAVRQSLAPGVAEIARRMYAPHGWDRAAEEKFVDDMMRAANGETVSPEAQRLFLMTHDYTPGRGYVPMTVWENSLTPHSPLSSSQSKVVGEAKSPLNTHQALGGAMSQGLRRTDVGEAVSSHVQKLFRYFNTLDHRELAASHGGAKRLSSDDVLMRVDRRTPAGMKLPAQKISTALKETLGILENKTGLPEAEQEGLSAGVSEALKDAVGHLFPRYGTDEELRRIDATAERGTEAPAGYVWVPRQLARLKDLEASTSHGDPSRLARFADNVNGAITAATVYFKIGHLTTRYFTNAAANIMQGSAMPLEIARSVKLSHELSPEEVTQALAYAGTHYYEAAPGATGSTVVGRGMQKGIHIPFTDKAVRTKSGEAVMSPQWWAHAVDAPFRFNSIAYEARKAGYEGADGFREFLRDVHDYNDLDTQQRAHIDGVLRRADREAIAYDRLNQFEKKFLSRVIWFYPWVKGSTVFTMNTALEHPFKAATLGALGQRGSEDRDKQIGDVPSYAQGLTPLTHGALPVVTDMNTFNPFSTAADLLSTPQHLDEIAGMANPLYGAALNTAEGVNPYGAKTPTPIQDNLKGLLASAPEYQIGATALDHGDQSHRLYPGGHGMNPLYKNWLGVVMRALVGPAAPRHVNPLAGHSLAERERTGR